MLAKIPKGSKYFNSPYDPRTLDISIGICICDRKSTFVFSLNETLILLELGLGKAHKSLAKKKLKHTTQSSIT